ncbi:uncharacterized protein VTP21DRAFT_6209 [Calcarisporiella thermophila]|uniref:uncharacterized protein n=1 Tax=Calcarisporiella thermophila TaxID=911321 RepID=UPI0037431692
MKKNLCGDGLVSESGIIKAECDAVPAYLPQFGVESDKSRVSYHCWSSGVLMQLSISSGQLRNGWRIMSSEVLQRVRLGWQLRYCRLAILALQGSASMSGVQRAGRAWMYIQAFSHSLVVDVNSGQDRGTNMLGQVCRLDGNGRVVESKFTFTFELGSGEGGGE